MSPEREAELRARWAEYRRAAGLDGEPDPEVIARVARILRGGDRRPKDAAQEATDGLPGAERTVV